MLEYDFLVESIPRRGMFVKKLSIEEMHDIYDVREGIETVAVRLVSIRKTEKQLRQLKNIWKPFETQQPIEYEKYRKEDDRFHALLLDFSGNKILQKIYNHSVVQLRVVQMGLMRPPEETLPEHLAILNAIEAGDSDKAENEMKKHLRKSKSLIQENLKY